MPSVLVHGVMAELDPDAFADRPIGFGLPEDGARNSVTFIDDAMKASILALYRSAVRVGAEWQSDIDPSRVATIIVEPVQDEGGFHRVPQASMRGLRQLRDVHGIVPIADEGQTGFGRTGRMRASDRRTAARGH